LKFARKPVILSLLFAFAAAVVALWIASETMLIDFTVRTPRHVIAFRTGTGVLQTMVITDPQRKLVPRTVRDPLIGAGFFGYPYPLRLWWPMVTRSGLGPNIEGSQLSLNVPMYLPASLVSLAAIGIAVVIPRGTRQATVKQS